MDPMDPIWSNHPVKRLCNNYRSAWQELREKKENIMAAQAQHKHLSSQNSILMVPITESSWINAI